MSKQIKHLPEISSFSKEQFERVLKLAFEMKKDPKKFEDALKRKTLVMWFEKPSLRTRLSFEAGMTQLGGHAIYLDPSTTHKGKADIKDEVKCLARFADILMARVYDHHTITQMIEAADIPVINGLSDLYHPCQSVADVMTVYEFTGKKNPTVAYVGDGNNVCNSLINACKILGIKINVATPEAMKPQAEPDFWTVDPKEAVADADVVYTDIWVSMGEEGKDTKVLEPYQVNKQLIGDKFFMHCLPAVRGSEVTDEVMDSPKSLVFDQAENRMHAQKAIMVELLS